MGGYLGHSLNVYRSKGLIDQNQAIWNAARSTHFEPGANGEVALLQTPVTSYLVLAVHLQGQRPRVVSLDAKSLHSPFYVDSRSLMRFEFVWHPQNVPMGAFFTAVALMPATGYDCQGITVLRNDTQISPSNSLSAPLWALNKSFAGDEFRIEAAQSLRSAPENWVGKKLVIASRDHDAGAARKAENTTVISVPVLGRWYASTVGPLRAGERLALNDDLPSNVYIAVGLLPQWMSITNVPDHL